ncbi:hypothetical protein HN51_035799 [Arachis hypogaea]
MLLLMQVTIAPRAGRELGYVRVKMDPIKFNEGMLIRQSVLDHITVQLAPRAADEIWFGSGQYDMGRNYRQSEVRSKDIYSWWAFREAPWNYQFLGGRPNKYLIGKCQCRVPTNTLFHYMWQQI